MQTEKATKQAGRSVLANDIASVASVRRAAVFASLLFFLGAARGARCTRLFEKLAQHADALIHVLLFQ